MLPNGGYPPISLCIKKEDKLKETPEKGFFYSTKTNNLNIRKILNKTKVSKKFIELSKEEDELEVIDSV